MSKKEIIKELKKLKVEFNENDKVEVLEELLNDAKGQTPNAVGKTQIKADKVLVWLKGRAYINDKERVDAGLYLLDECPERLAKLPNTVCEVLSTEVNSRKIAQIARWAGMNPDGMDDEEILSKVISPTFAPFS